MARLEGRQLSLTLIIIFWVLFAIVAVIADIVSDTIVKTTCIENGGSWKSGTCTIDGSNQ